MSQVKIISGDGSPADTRIFIDGVEQTDVHAYELRASAPDGGNPQLILHVNVTGLEVDASAEVEITRGDVTNAQTEQAFELVNQQRIIHAIGTASDATMGVNIPRMALRYMTLPRDVRLALLLELGLITKDEKHEADIDDAVRIDTEKDALGRALEQSAVSALDKAITKALNAGRQQQSGQQPAVPVDSSASVVAT